MRNVVNLLKKAIKDTQVSFVGDRIPMDPDTIRSLRSRIRTDLLPYCEGRSMIPVDLSANCESWIYAPNGSTDMSASKLLSIKHKLCGRETGSTVSFDTMPTQEPVDPGTRILDPGIPGSRILNHVDPGSRILDPAHLGSRILNPVNPGSWIFYAAEPGSSRFWIP